MSAAKPVLTYLVDAKRIVIWIGGPWDEFAEANDNPSLTAKSVLGSDLFSYIQGKAVRQVYHDMHELLLREPERVISFPYRCDGVKVRRLMTMELEQTDGSILYKSTIDGEMPLEKPLVIDYPADAPEFVAMCSWCKSYEYPMTSDTWRPIESIFEHTPPEFSISHGICPSCHKRMMRAMAERE